MASSQMTVPNRPLTWLITGCSSGMGLELARLVQRNGHTVIATSRNPSRTPNLVAEIEAKGGRWLALDLDDRNCGAVVETLEREGVAIDVLVNNAGWSLHGPAEALEEDEVRAMMETIFFGPYRLIRAVVPFMRKRRSGIVVNFSSGAGLDGRESMGAYAAAKAAMDGLSKVMAKELAPFNVRVLTLMLGTFDTPMITTLHRSRVPLDADYKGSMTERIMEAMGSGQLKADGSRLKATQAMYEVVVGEGVGKGRESERVLPLGRDLAKRIAEVVAGWDHAMEVFGEVCNNVYVTEEEFGVGRIREE